MTYAQPLSRAFAPFAAALALGAALSLSGCNQDDKALSAEDDSNPYFHAATAHIQERSFAEAAKSYEAALRANPDVAEAHYELGLLYADKLNDPIAAIYHYQLFLKARPAADNSQNAQERLNAAELNFAATVPNSPVQNAQAIVSLQSDKMGLQRDLETATKANADLQAKLASAQKELAAASPGLQANGPSPADTAAPAAPAMKETTSPAAAAAASQPASAPLSTSPPAALATAVPPASAAPAPAPAVQTGPAQTYTIVGGDTPWKIAAKFYPGHVAAGVEKIKEANPQMQPTKLKIGSQIQIPQ